MRTVEKMAYEKCLNVKFVTFRLIKRKFFTIRSKYKEDIRYQIIFQI